MQVHIGVFIYRFFCAMKGFGEVGDGEEVGGGGITSGTYAAIDRGGERRERWVCCRCEV